MHPIIKEDIQSILSASYIPWEKLKGKTVLVTGAAGMIASYIVFTLLQLDVKVIALVRNKTRAEKVFADYLYNKNLELLIQDVIQPIDYPGKIDFIIHAASNANPKAFVKAPVGTIASNVTGTINALELARQKKVESFLFLSSGETYGEVGSKNKLITEDSYGALNPAKGPFSYIESKRMGEVLCQAYFLQYGVPYRIARIFHTFGPGLDINNSRVYSDFISNILQGKDIVLHSDGSALRSYLYLTDTIKALFTILLKGKNGEAYNVANSDDMTSILEQAQMLTDQYPHLKVKIDIPDDNPAYTKMRSPQIDVRPSIAKLNSLGWTPTSTTKEAYIRTLSSLTD